jgi:hypothetical protein
MNYMHKQRTASILIAIVLIIAAAISRVVMYPDNFSPIIGMAIFAGAVLKDKRMAFLLPLIAMLLSDLMFEMLKIAPGFWGWGQLAGYCILGLITVIAFNLKKINVINVAGYSIMSSVIFFILSNLAFFLIDNQVYGTYSQDMNGFIQCYVSALPFFKTSFIADLVYSTVLFGSYYLVNNYVIRKAVPAKA